MHPMTSSSLIALLSSLCAVAAGIDVSQHGQLGRAQENLCPPARDVAPCVCKPSRRGLLLTCDRTNEREIGRIVDFLKQADHQDFQDIYSLRISWSSFPRLPSHFFMGLNVEHMSITYSNLTSVQPASLSSLAATLNFLDLSSNELTVMPRFDQQRLRNLRYLKLTHNKIPHLPKGAFDGMEALTQLLLYGNNIKSIDHHAFEGLSRNLNRLNLGGNHLDHVPTVAFKALPNLHHLDLHDNVISKISERDFPEELAKLDSLNLKNNSIQEVPALVFAHCGNLNSLDLSDNKIRFVDPDAFNGLDEKMEWLHLGHNPLTEIPVEALRPLKILKQLDLRDTNLSVIPEDAFKGYGSNIKWLHLQYNHIKKLPEVVFDGMDSLEMLQLYGNWIQHLSFDTVDSILDTINLLDLHENPLVCDCDLRWYREWLDDFHESDYSGMLVKNATCHVPHANVDKHIIEVSMDQFWCKGRSGYYTGAGLRPDLRPACLLLLLALATP